MSALARWCHSLGASIHGYDLQPTKLTAELEKEGMIIHYNIDPDKIPENVDAAIYTPAIPKENAEYIFFAESDIPLFKRSEFLGDISKDYTTIAIGGTHGKTSISAVTAHILKNAGVNVSAFVGGICRNYNTNLILSRKTEILVVEADEFDRSLLRLKPDIAVISSIDRDHLDIYSDHDDIKSTFVKFGSGIKNKGSLVHHLSTGTFDSLNCNKISYSAQNKAPAKASNIRIKDGRYLIDIVIMEMFISNISINVPGLHNIENALAAATVSYLLGLSSEKIKEGIETFLGVERRMDYRFKDDNHVYVDDYAHHPEEIRSTVETLRNLYPEKNIVGVFQPHLFSRTRDFAKEFSTELSKLDKVILLDIYPAREKPIPGISSQTIAAEIKSIPCEILDKTELINYITNSKPEVVVTMGAGDIGLLVEEIEQIYCQKC